MFTTHDDNIATFEIDYNTSGDKVIKAVAAGRLFLVTAVYLQVENTVDLQFKSGATDITGPIAFATAAQATVYWTNAGSPIFRGRAAGDDLILNLSGNVQVNGWVSLYTIDARNV